MSFVFFSATLIFLNAAYASWPTNVPLNSPPIRECRSITVSVHSELNHSCLQSIVWFLQVLWSGTRTTDWFADLSSVNHEDQFVKHASVCPSSYFHLAITVLLVKVSLNSYSRGAGNQWLECMPLFVRLGQDKWCNLPFSINGITLTLQVRSNHKNTTV